MRLGSVFRRYQQKLRRAWADFWVFWFELVSLITAETKQFVYNKTLPLTSRFLSRVPGPPKVDVKDVRANRIRLSIASSFSSPFNVEQFEVEWAPRESESWVSIGKSDLAQRTVARLKADAEYKFRVRAHNQLGVSRWSEVVHARSKIAPKNGGGDGPGFTWEQTPTDVTIMFELPPGVTKHGVRLVLQADRIRVEVAAGAGAQPQLLLDGNLYGKVKSFDNGSFWEMVKEGGKLMLILTLEKTSKSLAPKFDYWRAIVPGQHEIDTHLITSEEAGTGLQMINPGQYDGQQLRNMGLKGF